MFHAYRWTLSLSLIAMAAVAALADEAPPKPEPKSEGNKAPWTAKEIHDAWLKGKVFNYDIETEDGKGSTGYWEVDNVTDADFTMSMNIKEAGKELQPGKARKRTFEEHLNSLVKDIKDAETAVDTCKTTEGGEFACTVYTIKKENGWQKFWLSASLVGMPVKMERETKREEKRDYECWTLTSHDILRLPLAWTAKELAAAWKDGAWFKYSLTAEGQSGWMKITVSEVNEEGFTSVEESEFGGKASKDEPRKYTWAKFIRQMAAPKYGTTVSKEAIETKAGKFECTLYTNVEKEDGVESTNKVWFAKEVTGPWVKMTGEFKGGDKSSSNVMELMEYKIGK